MTPAVDPEGRPVWEYIGFENAIGFDPPTAPEPGSAVEAEYERMCP